MHDLKFSLPQVAYLLFLAIPLIFLIDRLARQRKQSLQNYVAPSHRSLLVSDRSPILMYAKNTALILAWIFGCFALMDPKGNLTYLNESNTPTSSIPQQKAREVIFLIDASTSMNVPDGKGGKTRFEEAKEIAEEIIQQINGQSVSVYAFTSQLTKLSPPTFDYLFARLVIRDMQINEGDVGGTNFQTILQPLWQKVFSHPSSKIYNIIILSDGEDDPTSDLQTKASDLDAIIKSIPDPNLFHLNIFSIGLGSSKGGAIPGIALNNQPVQSKLEKKVLENLASKGNGKFYEANAYNAWDLAHLIVNQLQKDIEYEEMQAPSKLTATPVKYDLYYQIPLGIALTLLLIMRILPDTWQRFSAADEFKK